MNVKAGYITLLGLPNAGKSSVLNKVLGANLAIVSPKAQTTWQNLKGHVVREGLEAVVIDTPGVQEGTKALNLAIARNAVRAVDSAREGNELIALVIDSFGLMKDLENKKDTHVDTIYKVLSREKIKLPLEITLIPTLNKSDLVRKADKRELVEEHVLKLAQKISGKVTRPHWISSNTGDGSEEWLETIKELLPELPKGQLFEEDTLSDANMRELVREYIRESCYYLLGQELPYSVAVEIDKFDESNPKLTRIEATLHVEKESQKPMIIGKGGLKIKQIGESARKRIEDFIGNQIFLGLRVKVSPGWAKEENKVKRFGYIHE